MSVVNQPLVNTKNVIVITPLSTKMPWPVDIEGPFGLRVKLPRALFTTHGEGFTLFLLKLNVKQESPENQFVYGLQFDPQESHPSL